MKLKYLYYTPGNRKLFLRKSQMYNLGDEKLLIAGNYIKTDLQDINCALENCYRFIGCIYLVLSYR